MLKTLHTQTIKSRYFPKQISAFLLSAALALVSGISGADDIEVYLGQAIGSYLASTSTTSNTAGEDELPNRGFLKNIEYATYFAEAQASSSSIVRNTVGYELFQDSPDWKSIPDFDDYAAVAQGTTGSISEYPRIGNSYYAFKYTSVINVPADGNYTFYTSSDDGSKLFIDGNRIVDNDGLHGTRTRSGSTWLKAGPHNLVVTFFERSGGDEIFAQWSGNGIAKQPVEPWLLPLPNRDAVTYDYFEGNWTNLPDFDALTAVSSGTINNFTLAPKLRNDNYGFRFNSKLNIPKSADYTFYLGSDDGSQLYIDGEKIIDNDGIHGNDERTKTVYLAGGIHTIKVNYFNAQSGGSLAVKWSSDEINKQDIATWLSDGGTVASTSISGSLIKNASYTGDEYLSETNGDPDGSTSSIELDETATATPWELYHAGTNSSGNDIVTIISSVSDRILYDSGSSAKTDEKGWSEKHRWEMIEQTDGSYQFKNLSTNRYLYADSGTSVKTSSTSTGENRKWSLNSAAPNAITQTDTSEWEFIKANITEDGNQTIRLRNSETGGYLGTHQSGGNALVYIPVTVSAFEEWEIIDAGRDIIQLRNSGDGRYLLASGTDNQFNVSTHPGPAASNDMSWTIIPLTTSTSTSTGTGIVQPNILFVLDASGSMNWTDSGEEGTRLERMKDALNIVINSISDVNVGLMRFSHSYSGGRILHPVAPIGNIRQNLIGIVDDIVASHGTPTVGALFEAARYFRGEAVEFGKKRAYNYYYSGSQYSRVSTPSSYTGGTVVRSGNCNDGDPNHRDCRSEYISGSPVYTSPMISECQSNHIVILTDGTPTSKAVYDAQKLVPGNCAVASAADGQCGEELANFLATNDQSGNVTNTNTITTHTIGFNFSNEWLKSVAAAGQGKFYTADSASELQSAIESVLADARAHEHTIVAPTVSIDQTTRISHRNDIYLALFEPSYSAAWPGNLKRYHFDGDIKDSHNPPALAVDPDTGTFLETAKSYWSPSIDGGNVVAGGAASQLDLATRTVTTYLPGNSPELTDTSNLLSSDNLTAAHFGLPDTSLNLTSQDKDQLVLWAKGVDVLDWNNNGDFTDTRKYIGDPLHSTPAIITYDWTGTEHDSVIFFGTNEGYLHAINSADGGEVFSYIPQSLLGKLKYNYVNQPGYAKTYGLDGPLTTWVQDKNYNSKITEDDDQAFLYAGMRRGGRDYIALDVTKKEKPKHKWTIKGGQGDFTELGQTWSKPTLATVNHPTTGAATKVLVFGGGYDTRQDDVSVRSVDSVGRALYMVDADSGDLIWRASPNLDANLILSDMQYSMPSDPRVVDMDGDGLAEQIYIGDMGGQIWRFDIDNNASYAADFIKAGVIANLAGDEEQNARRFYNTPDISLIKNDDEPTLAIAIGSGYRAHPLDTRVKDRFYVLQQPVTAGQYGVSEGGSYRAVNNDDLFDVTDNAIGEGDDNEKTLAIAELETASGWFLELKESGEKTLSTSVTINNQVMFTSYKPGEGGACDRVLGGGNLYVLDIYNGTPVLDLFTENNPLDNSLTKEDRIQSLERPGIPPSPRMMFPESSSPILMIGPEKGPDVDVGPLMRRMWWSEIPDF